MKKHLCFLCLSLLLSLSQTSFGQGVLRFTIVAMQKDTSLSAPDRYNVLPRLRAMLREQEGVEWFPDDSVRAVIGANLAGSFCQDHGPVSLLLANRKLHLDVVLAYSADLSRDTLTVRLEAKSFPQGITLATTRIPMSQKQTTIQQNQLLRSRLQSLLLETIDQRHAFGFPFNESERGLVVLTSPLTDSAGAIRVSRFLAGLNLTGKKPVRVHLFETDLTLPFCEQAAAVAEERSAELVLALDNVADSSGLVQLQFYFRPEKLALPVVNWTLPIKSAYAPLCCDSTPAGDLASAWVNAALFQDLAEGDAFLPELEMMRNDESMIVNHIPLWSAFAVRVGRGLNEAPADSMRWVASLLEKLILASKPAEQRGWLHLNLANLHERWGQDDLALASYLQADTLLAEAKEIRGSALSRWRRGLLLSKQKQHRASRLEFARSVQAFQTIGDSSSMADAMYKIAMLYELDERPDDARAVYFKTAALYEQLHRSYEAAHIYDHLGQIAREKSDPKEAMKQFDAYLVSAREMHSEPAMARAHFQIGLTFLQDQQLEPALENFNSAMDLFELLGDQRSMARTDLNLGMIKQQQGNLDAAKSHYLTALQVAESMLDTSTVVLCQTNLAELALMTKSWEEVHDHYDQALTMAQLLQNTKEQANILYAKGLAHLKEGRLKAGYSELQQALTLAGGTVSGDVEKERAFMQKLESLIGDINHLRGSVNER